jgi:DeoR family suf operon transcriptional repressor
MQGLHENQTRILEYLLDHPEGATLDELVSHLGITRTAVKEHIIRVEDLGYIVHNDTRGSVGRPKRRYLLSDSGVDAFPKKYSWLSNVMLEELAEEMGSNGIARFMRALADKVAQSMEAQFNSTAPADRIKAAAKLLNELGYRASVKAGESGVIEATNCVYHSVAKAHPELCQFDIRLLEKATGKNVRLEKCIARGDGVCRFCMKGK